MKRTIHFYDTHDMDDMIDLYKMISKLKINWHKQIHSNEEYALNQLFQSIKGNNWKGITQNITHKKNGYNVVNPS